jgi:hypothetical protein
MRIPTKIFEVQGGSPQTRQDATRLLRSLGAVPATAGEAPELVVWCDTAYEPLPEDWVSLDDLISDLSGDHRVRDTKSVADLPKAEPRSQLLAGRTVAMIGSLSRSDIVAQLVARLGGQMVAPPAIEADIVICGSTDGMTERMKALRADPIGRLILSEWQFYDLCEPQFSPFPPDGLQRELAVELRSTDLRAARQHARRPYALGF